MINTILAKVAYIRESAQCFKVAFRRENLAKETGQDRGPQTPCGGGPRRKSRDERGATIGELAREFKMTLRTLRFYKDRGLLHPHRNGMARLYSDRDRQHLQMILKGRQLGFTLTEIQEIL